MKSRLAKGSTSSALNESLYKSVCNNWSFLPYSTSLSSAGITGMHLCTKPRLMLGLLLEKCDGDNIPSQTFQEQQGSDHMPGDSGGHPDEIRGCGVVLV